MGEMIQGDNEALWWSNEKSILVERIVLFKVNDKFGQWPANEVSEYQKISPVEYQGKLKVENSGYLLFKESWHPAWQLSLIDSQTGEVVKSYQPILVNGWEQGYLIDKQGEYDFVISYQLSGIYRWLLFFSGIFSFVLILFSLYFLVAKSIKNYRG
jgi:hypothetical protein